MRDFIGARFSRATSHVYSAIAQDLSGLASPRCTAPRQGELFARTIEVAINGLCGNTEHHPAPSVLPELNGLFDAVLRKPFTPELLLETIRCLGNADEGEMNGVPIQGR